MPDDVTFRSATAGDVPAVVALVESAYRGETSRRGWTTEADILDGQRTDAAAVEEIVNRAGARVLMAVDRDGELLACCHLERSGERAGYFGMFAVRPGLQGRGIGRTVVARAERLAVEEWEATEMRMTVLHPRRDLIAWYERLGYELTGETEPFPHGDERYGRPRRADLHFVVLAKALGRPG